VFRKTVAVHGLKLEIGNWKLGRTVQKHEGQISNFTSFDTNGSYCLNFSLNSSDSSLAFFQFSDLSNQGIQALVPAPEVHLLISYYHLTAIIYKIISLSKS